MTLRPSICLSLLLSLELASPRLKNEGKKKSNRSEGAVYELNEPSAAILYKRTGIAATSVGKLF